MYLRDLIKEVEAEAEKARARLKKIEALNPRSQEQDAGALKASHATSRNPKGAPAGRGQPSTNASSFLNCPPCFIKKDAECLPGAPALRLRAGTSRHAGQGAYQRKGTVLKPLQLERVSKRRESLVDAEVASSSVQGAFQNEQPAARHTAILRAAPSRMSGFVP